MGVIQFVLLAGVIVLLAAIVIWAIGYFAPSPVPDIIPKLIWGLVIVALLFILLNATGIMGYDIPIPRVHH